MQLEINPLIADVKESATLAINMKVRELRDQGEQVFHFGFGESPFPVPNAIRQALAENSHQKAYLPTRGLPALLDAVVNFYGEHCGLEISQEQVFIGPGSKELIFQAIYLLEGPLLVPAPSWVSYGPQAALRGKQVVAIPTSRDQSYKLSTSDLEDTCSGLDAGQKILILNSPNNPTGAHYDDVELASLVAACRKHNIIVISDEIYSLVRFDNQPHTSIAHHYPEATLVTSGLSKAFSAGGYRLGTMIVPTQMQSLMKALMAMISETFSAVSAPIQYAAITAFEFGESVASDVARYTEIHQYAARYLHQRFVDMGLNCPLPMGAFYLFPDFEQYREKLAVRGILSSGDLANYLLDEINLAVLPGDDFYLARTHLGVRVASVDYDGELLAREFPGQTKMTEGELLRLFPNLVEGCNRLQALLVSI